MRAVWVDSQNDANPAALKRHGITRAFFHGFDDPVHMRRAEALGFGIGVYFAWNWDEFMGASGAEMAEVVDQRVTQIAPGSGPALPRVQFDIELHDADWVLDCFRRWRELRPTRETSWTLESHQSGWFTRALVDSLILRKVRIIPQLYLGDMTPVDGLFEMKSLIASGVPAVLVSGFYDAAALPAWWDGFAFSMGRLPA